MVRDQPKERRRLGTSGLVDAARHRGRVGHARSGTEERRAYIRLGCGPAPFRCATGRFDAPSARRRPNEACCSRAFSEARCARNLLERPLQKLALAVPRCERTVNKRPRLDHCDPGPPRDGQ
jgi:hypothetical protein